MLVFTLVSANAQDSGEDYQYTQYEQYYIDSNDYCGGCGDVYWRALIFGGNQSNPQIRSSVKSNYSSSSNLGQDLFFWIGKKDVMRLKKHIIQVHVPFEVNGRIRAKSLLLENQNWADYVFEEDYELMPLDEVEMFIKEHKHLPGIPSSEEVLEEGIEVEKVNEILLKKIEELTLYVIDLEKKLSNLEK